MRSQVHLEWLAEGDCPHVQRFTFLRTMWRWISHKMLILFLKETLLVWKWHVCSPVMDPASATVPRSSLRDDVMIRCRGDAEPVVMISQSGSQKWQESKWLLPDASAGWSLWNLQGFVTPDVPRWLSKGKKKKNHVSYITVDWLRTTISCIVDLITWAP